MEKQKKNTDKHHYGTGFFATVIIGFILHTPCQTQPLSYLSFLSLKGTGSRIELIFFGKNEPLVILNL
jgi:hypothetical protein